MSILTSYIVGYSHQPLLNPIWIIIICDVCEMCSHKIMCASNPVLSHTECHTAACKCRPHLHGLSAHCSIVALVTASTSPLARLQRCASYLRYPVRNADYFDLGSRPRNSDVTTTTGIATLKKWHSTANIGMTTCDESIGRIEMKVRSHQSGARTETLPVDQMEFPWDALQEGPALPGGMIRSASATIINHGK